MTPSIERRASTWARRARVAPRRILARGRREFEARGGSGLGGRVILNSGWLMAERVLHMGVAFAVTIWMARYLGPEQYGLLAYGISLLLIVDIVATLGMRNVVVQELVEHREREAEIVGTAVAIKLLGALVAMLLLIGGAAILGGGSDTFPVIAILALGLPFSALTSFDLSFQSSLQSQYGVGARVAGFGLATLLRVALLLTGGPLVGFAIAAAIEFAATGIGFAVAYRRLRGPLYLLRFSGRVARHLVVASWPLFLSALAASIYLKIDQVMLQAFAGSAEVGVYAPAARFSEVWYFIPVAMGSSLLPLLVTRRLESPEVYRASLQRAFDITAWIAIALAVGVMLLAGPLTAVLGPEYSRTAGILRIHVWAAPFVFMGTVLGRALIAENRRGFELTRHTAGAVLNVVLNLALIPTLGATGAALSTVVSYACASYVICFSSEPTRVHARQMTAALIWPLRAWAETRETRRAEAPPMSGRVPGLPLWRAEPAAGDEPPGRPGHPAGPERTEPPDSEVFLLIDDADEGREAFPLRLPGRRRA